VRGCGHTGLGIHWAADMQAQAGTASGAEGAWEGEAPPTPSGPWLGSGRSSLPGLHQPAWLLGLHQPSIQPSRLASACLACLACTSQPASLLGMRQPAYQPDHLAPARPACPACTSPSSLSGLYQPGHLHPYRLRGSRTCHPGLHAPKVNIRGPSPSSQLHTPKGNISRVCHPVLSYTCQR